VASELLVRSPSELAGSYVAYPIIYRNNFHNETLDGDIVLGNATDVTNKIVLLVYFRATYLTQIRTQQNRGARAVIISSQPGGKYINAILKYGGNNLLTEFLRRKIFFHQCFIGSDSHYAN